MKYRNVKATIDSMKFDSRGEGMRWLALRQEERNGTIEKLQRQIAWKLFGKNNTAVCVIKVDFQYVENGAIVVEDWKGMETEAFRLKEKLFKDNYPGVEFRKSGAWKQIRDKKNARARARRQKVRET